MVELRPDSEEVEPFRQSEGDEAGQAFGSARGKSKVEAPCFGGSLDPEYLLDWVGDLEKYFKWEEIEDPRRVKFSCTRRKGHVGRWWEHMQGDRVLRGE